MTKDKWIEHMVATTGKPAPTKWSMTSEWNEWRAEVAAHKERGCPECKERRDTKIKSLKAKAREDLYRSCGLTKVIGSVSGSVYWE